jgi:hypothetical protein
MIAGIVRQANSSVPPGCELVGDSSSGDDRPYRDRIDLVSLPGNRDLDVGPGYLAGWRARGHPDLEGYGWYRRRVALPPQGNFILLGQTMVDDGYEMFWNGRRIGGVGKLDRGQRSHGPVAVCRFALCETGELRE